MHAEFFREDAADEVVGTATWTGAGVTVSAEDPKVRRVIERIFRSTPLAVDDAALRAFGTSGPEVLPPGSLRWFMAAARTRGAAEHLGVRFVPQARGQLGFDPAGGYRKFPAAVERRERLGLIG